MNAVSIEVAFPFKGTKESWARSLKKSGWISNPSKSTLFYKMQGDLKISSLFKERTKEILLCCSRLKPSKEGDPLPKVYQLPLFKVEEVWPDLFKKDSQPHYVIIITTSDYTEGVLSPLWKEVSKDPVTFQNSSMEAVMIQYGEYVPPYAPREVERNRYYEFFDEAPGPTGKYLERLQAIGFPILTIF